MKIDLTLLAQKFDNVEFFLTCFFPSEDVQFSGAPPAHLCAWQGPDFLAVTSRTRESGSTLFHDLQGVRGVFRGYEGEVGVHSYSPPDVLQRVLADPACLENGVFASLSYFPDTATGIVRNDAVGFAPLYYRQIGRSWWFASHAALLHLDGDEQDLPAWTSLLQGGHVFDGRTIYRHVKRLDPGTHLTLTREDAVNASWFSFDELPPGEQAIDDAAFEEVEHAYQNAVDRCLRLRDSYILPLSSGYDSRRFFASLTRRQLPFKAVTCQSFHRKNGRDYDIDAHFAPQIARAFGVDCEVVPASLGAQIDADERYRQDLIGTETFMHGWSVPLMRWLSGQRPSIVFDGLAGDTYGNSGYEIDGLHADPASDVELILDEVSSTRFFDQVAGPLPDRAAFRQAYRTFLERFSPNPNQAEYAFLQARTRRCISPWITMMHPPGHVVVFPYCDTEFVRATMKYHPADKYKWFFQRECLKRFYPEYYAFPGSRNLPPDHPPRDQATTDAVDAAQENYLYGNRAHLFSAAKYLSWKNKAILIASAVMPGLRSKRRWLFDRLLALVKTQHESTVFIQAGADPALDNGRQESLPTFKQV